jgi:tetratricopeptide (TPR) repeat protein
MKKAFAVALILCLALPALLVAEEAPKKPPSPLQVYLKDKSAEKFADAHTAYMAQIKDTMNYGSITALAWLHMFELDRYLEFLNENLGELKNMQKFQYANMLLELDRNEDAIAVYEKIVEANPKWSCPWRHMGEAYYKMKNYAQAEKALLMAIETREEHYDAYMWLAEVYHAWGKYDKGIKTLETGLTWYGKDIEDPEEEYSSAKVAFLHLDLLKGAKKTKTEAYRHALEHARKFDPENERLKNY